MYAWVGWGETSAENNSTNNLRYRLDVSDSWFVRSLDVRAEPVKRQQLRGFPKIKKVRPAPGGGPAARKPGLGTGRGGDVTGLA